MSFSGQGGFNLDEYELYDAMTGMTYPLSSDVEIESGASVGRYSICKAGSRAAFEYSTYLLQDRGTVTAYSNKGEVVGMKAYNVNGVLEHASETSSVTANYGINVIVVTLDDGTTETFKVMVR